MAAMKHDDGGSMTAKAFFARQDAERRERQIAFGIPDQTLLDYFAGQPIPQKLLESLGEMDDKHLAEFVGADPDEMQFLLRPDRSSSLYQENNLRWLRWQVDAIAILRYRIGAAMIAEKRRRESETDKG